MNKSKTNSDGQAIAPTRTAHLSAVSVPEARDRAVRELGEEGFGLLAEIDLAATLARRLDKTFSPFLVLEVCHPKLAERALSITKDAGMLLPCKVCVWQEAGGAAVSFASPRTLVTALAFEGLNPLAAEVEEHLARALARLSASH